MTEVNEGSAAFFSVLLDGPDGTAAIPAAATIKLLNVTAKTVVRDTEDITPPLDSTLAFKTLKTENVVVKPRSSFETMRIIVEADYGVGDAIVTTFDYRVNRVGFD